MGLKNGVKATEETFILALLCEPYLRVCKQLVLKQTPFPEVGQTAEGGIASLQVHMKPHIQAKSPRFEPGLTSVTQKRSLTLCLSFPACENDVASHPAGQGRDDVASQTQQRTMLEDTSRDMLVKRALWEGRAVFSTVGPQASIIWDLVRHASSQAIPVLLTQSLGPGPEVLFK